MHDHSADCGTRIWTFYTVKDKEQTKIYPIRKVNSVPSRCTHATHVRRFWLPKCSAAGDREVVEVLFVYVLLDVTETELGARLCSRGAEEWRCMC